MSAGEASPQREATPTTTLPVTVPQKRALEDDHQPAVSSPLNPDFKSKDDAPLARERASRAKKESLKKRESKAGSLAPDTSARATPDPKASTSKSKKEDEPDLAPIRYKLPPPKSTDFEAPRGPVFIPAHIKSAPDGTKIQFNETTDHVYNKKNFHYTHCIADPAFPSSLYYRQSETEPFYPRLNFEDTSTHMFLDEGGRHITTDKGFRMAKGNVCVREGRYYWECKITSGIPKRKRSDAHAPESDNGHVRMGWARREATLDAPVGFDAYSYGLRDVKGQKVHMSRPKDFFPPGEDIREGDVIGLEINLPSESLHRKVVESHYNPAVDLADEGNTGIERPDIIRDRVPIRFKAHLYFEQIEYHSCKELEELMNPSPVISSSGGVGGAIQEPYPTHPVTALRTLPHSSIKVYKNGQLIGTPFTNLLAFLPPASKPLPQVGAREGLDDGMLGYYPAVSVFRGGAAEVNFGPDFWYPPPGLEDQDDEVDMIGSDQPPTTSDLQRLRAVCERYDEQVVEDIVYDIIDEVDFWMQDGGVSGKGVTKAAGVSVPSDMAGGVLGSEIKELVQEDD
ncbi:hypothetical protein BDZ45DRAFT_674568 [Acephala macrosclerotiorum]|nr:hypothetical protein BDZ45DRAFT_674568 [Acephala macrosclerotiorum]